jgi:GGDEF domain-containing protein
MEILGQDIDEVLHVKTHAGLLPGLGQLGEAGWHGEVMCRRKNGETFPAWEHICLVSYDLELPAHYIIGCTDVSSIKKAEIELNRMAFHDALTDLAIAFAERTTGHRTEARRRGWQPDGPGIHRSGWFQADQRRHGPCHRRPAAQSGGTAHPRNHPPRGHSGALWRGRVLHHLPAQQRAGLHQHGQPPAGKLEQPMPAGKDNIVVTASIGIALYPQHGTSAEKLLSAADSAMYQAKLAGKRRYCTFNESMAEKVHERLRLEQRLRQAVKQRSFTLHYQPLIRVEDASLIGFEALLRWQDEG